MPYKLETSEQIIRFVENLAYHIEHVKIDDVGINEFHFKVLIPYWYKIAFGYFLKRKIQREVSKRLYIGVDFTFDLYSETLF